MNRSEFGGWMSTENLTFVWRSGASAFITLKCQYDFEKHVIAVTLRHCTKTYCLLLMSEKVQTLFLSVPIRRSWTGITQFVQFSFTI